MSPISKEDRQLEVIEEFYPGVDKLINDEVVLSGEFEKKHAFQFFIALQRKFADLWNKDIQEVYDDMFRPSNRGGGGI